MGDYRAGGGTDAQQYVWKGAIPLQIHLHDPEVTTLPPPPPALILAPRTGYLPLLVPQIKPFFSSSLPPGVDTVWFEYKGLPLKWYIPTGVLFDLLCAEPERPWNLIEKEWGLSAIAKSNLVADLDNLLSKLLTIHFRGYPGTILTPCEGEDSVKWSFINALKEAAYIINGNCKNIMNMSQSDQAELWRSVLNGQLDAYLPVSLKLKLQSTGDDSYLRMGSSVSKHRQVNNDTDGTGTSRTGRIPVRLYIRIFDGDIDDLDDVPTVDSWEKISYINRPVEVQDAGKNFTLLDAIKALLPELFLGKSSIDADTSGEEAADTEKSEDDRPKSNEETEDASSARPGLLSSGAEIKLVRIQGIEPLMEIPFGWVVTNLMNPEHYLHISLYLKSH